MQRPAPPDVQFDFNRPLDQPEDEFFALPLDDDLEGVGAPSESQGPLAGVTRAAERLGAIRKLGGKVRERVQRRDEDAELAEIVDFSSFGTDQHMDVMGSELDEHMVRLTSSHDLEAFMAAEQESSLFEEYEREVSANLRVSSWGLMLAAVMFLWVGYKHGLDYLKTLTDIHTPVTGPLKEALPAEQARGAQVVAGFLAPAVAFLVMVQAFTDTLGGVLMRSLSRAVPGMVGLIGGWVALGMLGSGQYLNALITGVVLVAVSRFVAAVLRAAGVK